MSLLPCYCTWSKIERRKVLLPLKQLKCRIGGIAHAAREGELALWCWVLLEYCEKQREVVNLWQRGRVKCKNSSCPHLPAVINSPSCFYWGHMNCSVLAVVPLARLPAEGCGSSCATPPASPDTLCFPACKTPDTSVLSVINPDNRGSEEFCSRGSSCRGTTRAVFQLHLLTEYSAL